MRDDPADLFGRVLKASAARARAQQLRRALEALAGSGVQLAQEELLDALWLAERLPKGASTSLARASGTITPARQAYGDGWLPPAVGPRAEPRPAQPGPPRQGEADARSLPSARSRPAERPLLDIDPDDETTALLSTRTVRIHKPVSDQYGGLYGGTAPDRAPRPRTAPARTVRAPGTRALGSRQLQLGRALRPLKQTVGDHSRWELDETATADATAHSGLTDAVLRPARARWLHLTLLVDDGASMLLWQRLATETRLLLERSGAFRDVRVHGLDTRTPGAPLLGRRPFTPGTAVLPPATVTDPGGTTLILVLSDGVGAAWRDGRMPGLLRQWGRFGPTAVLHTLPPELWDGSGIRAERWQVTTRRRGAPNLTWEVADPVLPPGLAAYDGVPVPVLTPEPAAVGAWADLVASPGASAVLPLLSAPFEIAPEPLADLAAGERVLRFRDTASPQAYRLAAHLAGMAPVSVPVMRLVQEALGPDVRTGHLAEVFLSGLLRRCDDVAELAPQHRSYDVTAETREILLDAAPVRELLRTSRSVTDRLGRLAGRSADFPAWLAHPEGAARAGGGARPFGWVDERLMRRLGVGVPRPVPVEPAEPELPPYIDAPGSEWLGLLPGNPRWAGPWRLFARHAGARSSSGMFLGRRADGEVAAIRLTRPNSVRRASLPRQAQALRLLAGGRAPGVVGMDPGATPHWLATELRMTDGRPDLHLESLTAAGRRWSDPREFAELGHRIADTLARAHMRGIVHGDLVPRRVLITPDDVCVTGWCVQEHADGTEHDISKLGLLLTSAAGGAVPAPFTDLVRRCSSPLLDQRPTAADVASRFEAFRHANARPPAPRDRRAARLTVPVGRDEHGADVVLDIRAMGPHGVVQGTDEDCSTVLEGIVRSLADRYPPSAVRFYLLNSTDQYLRSGTSGTLPHIVTGAIHPLEDTLEAERAHRRAVLAAARAAGAPRPDLTSLIVVLGAQGLHGDMAWLEDLDIHLLLVEGPRRGPVDFDFRIDLTRRGGPVLHHSGAPGSGVPFLLPLPRRVPHEALLAAVFRSAVDHGVRGHHEEALAWLEDLGTRQLERLGPNHPHLLVTRHEIGHLQLALDRLDDALGTFAVCATARDAVLGREHVDTLLTHQMRAFVLFRLGRHDEAYTICHTVLPLWESVRGPLHPDTLLCRHNLTAALIVLRRHDEAVRQARATHDGRRTALGDRHPDTLASGHALALALSGAGNTLDAHDVASSVLDARADVLGHDHPDTVATRRLVKDLLRPQG
ncbi:SAV_2336 N-terminal domain-related protein [Streptomyces sp. NPDC093510]|uniref:SAV_2336 N-terminal domain-related protein n=1 Tax=Streptomyces sp. NPDC093510 TaxID=3155199 RepID=UPI00343B8CB1